ncbi:MAG: HIT domain-containing protein [Candidatus Spechtbacteria bacterium]|nr:HIT domain-containing protein [Candidatus Spechtbacteria bacterium]
MCIFCEIAQRKQPADIVYENATVIAFRDIHPKAPVHILIVSKKHIASVKEIEMEDCGLLVDILCAAKKIAEDQKVDEGYKLIFNVGRKGGQVIDHLHLHLLGGF